MSSIAFTSSRSAGHSDVYLWLRRNLSLIIATATLVAIGAAHGAIANKFSAGGWKIDAYYSAIFNWAAFQGAFLFSVYAFFLSRSEPFIKAVEATPAFRNLRKYVLRSLWLSMGLTLASLPAVVAAPTISADAGLLDPGFIIFWVMSTLLAYTFGNFVKVIRVFRLLEGMGNE